jgi:hypothetical protein
MNKLFAILSTLALTLPTAALATPRAVDNGLMTDVPGYGPSRVETVTFCLNEVGVDTYQNLVTDTEVEAFGACLVEMT